MSRLGIRFFVILICIGSMAMISGCISKKSQNKYNTGGTTDNTDYNAPKVIESDDLVLFETKFYRHSDYVYDKNRDYRFKMSKNDNGTYIISEGENETLKCETDAEFAQKLEQIIRNNNLVELNGIHKQTAGISPEYGPYWVEASYGSSEKLYFFMNGDPDAEWTFEVLDLFANEFGNHGITDLLPVKEESKITRFSIEYSYGDISYSYGEILVPVTEEEKNRDFEDIATNGVNKENCVKMIYADSFDRTGKTGSSDDRRVEITDDYYDRIKEIVDDNNLIYFQNGEVFPFNFDYENTPVFFEFYIEYENGKIMSGFSDDSDTCEQFKDIAEQFSGFFDSYLEENTDNEQ